MASVLLVTPMFLWASFVAEGRGATNTTERGMRLRLDRAPSESLSTRPTASPLVHLDVRQSRVGWLMAVHLIQDTAQPPQCAEPLEMRLRRLRSLIASNWERARSVATLILLLREPQSECARRKAILEILGRSSKDVEESQAKDIVELLVDAVRSDKDSLVRIYALEGLSRSTSFEASRLLSMMMEEREPREGSPATIVVRGRVTDRQGSSVALAELNLTLYRDECGRSALARASTVTETDGTYEIAIKRGDGVPSRVCLESAMGPKRVRSFSAAPVNQEGPGIRIKSDTVKMDLVVDRP